MAPSWLSSRQSAWGLASGSDRPNSRFLVILGISILIVGIAAGYFVGSSSSTTPNSGAPSNPGSSGTAKGATTADVIATGIAPNLAAMNTQPQTLDGATQAATSFIAGFPELSVKSLTEQNKAVSDAVAPTADPALRNSFLTLLSGARAVLLGPPGAERPTTAKLITSPLTYRAQWVGEGNTTVRVQIWYLSLFLRPDAVESQAVWSSSDTQLQWSDHWRITSHVVTNGPTPRIESETGTVSSFDEVLQRFSGFRAYQHAIR